MTAQKGTQATEHLALALVEQIEAVEVLDELSENALEGLIAETSARLFAADPNALSGHRRASPPLRR